MNRTTLTMTVVTALVLTGCSESGPEPDPAPASVEAEAVEPAPDPEPEPEPEPEHSGDYTSVGAYHAELLDTATKMGNLLDTTVETIDSVVNGALTPSQGQVLMETAAAVTRTHIDFYATRTPPAEFAEVDRLLIGAMTAHERSFEEAARCMETLDPSYCEDATASMQEGTSLMNQATDEVVSLTP